ncbi:MAG TPA: BatD family protein, partial [Woeseiaceae bacterium]
MVKPVNITLGLALAVLSLLPAGVTAAVVASIDRDTIELNESFTLKVLVDTAIDREPDAAALNDDFEVLTRSELSNTT